jgi:DNA helicase-2/ATP-dependent DNA helicase PcrA
MTASAKSPSASHDSSPKSTSAEAPGGGQSIDNIARFFGGKGGFVKPGSLSCPAMDIPAPTGATHLRKGQRVRHSKYGEGTVLFREGDGEDAKLTVMFIRHGMKKLMEKFANLQKI